MIFPSKTGVKQVFQEFTEGKTTYAEVSEGVRSATSKLAELIDSKQIDLRQLHLMQLLEETCAPKYSPLREKYGEDAFESALKSNIGDAAEAIASSRDFPTIFTKYIHNEFIPNYEQQMASIAPLYTEVVGDQRIQFYAGLEDDHEPERAGEMEHYAEGTQKEKYVEIESHKYGRIVPLSKEMLLYDKTGGMLIQRLRDQSDALARFERRWIITRVQDAAFTTNNFSQAANTTFKYKGSTAALYSSDHSAVDRQTNDNTVSATTITTANLQSCMSKLAAMTNTLGQKLNLVGDTLLVPTALAFDAMSIAGSPGQFDSANRSLNPVNVLGLTANVLHDINVTASTFYWGDFRKQFVLQVVQPMTQQNIGAKLERGVVQRWLIEKIAGFGARDYRWVVKAS